MSNISQWSPVAAGNNDPPPDGAPEGMPASSVNDTIRENMAAGRRFAEDGGWFNWGHSYTFLSATSFEVAGDESAVYTEGRRVRVAQTATVYGTITGVVVTANTAVTVALDAGVIANEAMQVAVGVEATAGAAPLPSGTITMYGGTSAPGGYLMCNGASYPVATYAALWAVIGDVFGGDGGTNFNVPSMANNFPIGVGSNALAATGGEATVALDANNIPEHTHPIDAGASGGNSARGGSWDGDGGTQTTRSTGVNVSTVNAHNNIPPFLALNYIIKT